MNPVKRSGVPRKIGDFLGLCFFGIVGAILLMVVLFYAGQWFLRESSKRKKAEIATIFTQAINEREVTNVAGGKFVVTQRHTGDPFYTIWFSNSIRQRTGYFVSEEIYKKGMWEFKELPAEENLPRKVFYRARTTER